VLTRNQCQGHKTKDINAAVCMHTSLVRQTTCEHPRCDDCKIGFGGSFDLFGITVWSRTLYPVGRYPGAEALEKKLEKAWRRAYKDRKDKARR